MNKYQVNKHLKKLGLYRIYWKKSAGGGTSVASVGMTHDGTRWYSPTNWTSQDNDKPIVSSTDWTRILKVELITVE